MNYFKTLLDHYSAVAALLLVALVLATACGGPTVEAPEETELPEEKGTEETDVVPLTEEALRNGTYRLDELGTISLSDGEYRDQYGEGATQVHLVGLEMTTFGDLNGDGLEDAAVVLWWQSGGTGTFRYLAAVLNDDGAPRQAGVARLGDRARIDGLSIDAGEIVIDAVTHSPDDPMCCPTQRVEQTYAVQGDELVQTASQVISSGEAAGSDVVAADIAGMVWTWDRFGDATGQTDIVVPYPPAYRLELHPDGYFDIKADCNRGGGTYTLDGSSLTLELGPMTLAECEPGSLYDEYIDLLGPVVTYAREGDSLILNLAADGGTMKFSRLHAVTGRITVPVGATLPEKAEVEAKVVDAAGTQVGGQIIFDVTQFPVKFEATYNPPAIQPNETYVLEVTIKDGQGNLVLKTLQPHPVLTQGNPTYHVGVVVEPVGD